MSYLLGRMLLFFLLIGPYVIICLTFWFVCYCMSSLLGSMLLLVLLIVPYVIVCLTYWVVYYCANEDFSASGPAKEYKYMFV